MDNIEIAIKAIKEAFKNIDYSKGADLTVICLYDKQAEAVISALAKQKPKKPNKDNCCPDCNTYLKDDNGIEGLYCPNCGQKINWEA